MRDAFLLSMNKKALIFLIILAAIAGGFFYFWEVWLPAQIEKEQKMSEEKTQPPTLFRKEDYKIEEREDGKYIIVEKVGLTAKVPEGWRVKIEKGSSYPEPGYWIRLFSEDYKPSSYTITLPGGGCRIDISGWISQESNQKRKKIIQDLENNDTSSVGEIYNKEGYEYRLIKVSGYKGIEQRNSEDHKLSKFIHLISVDIPINDENIVTLYIDFPPDNKEKCMEIWKKFLENVVIE